MHEHDHNGTRRLRCFVEPCTHTHALMCLLCAPPPMLLSRDFALHAALWLRQQISLASALCMLPRCHKSCWPCRTARRLCGAKTPRALPPRRQVRRASGSAGSNPEGACRPRPARRPTRPPPHPTSKHDRANDGALRAPIRPRLAAYLACRRVTPPLPLSGSSHSHLSRLRS